jgi:hypothetical protein
MSLLRRYIRCTNDANSRINQEESQNLAVAWFRGVGKLEWLNLVLEDVGECEEATFLADHRADFLHCRLVICATEDFGQPVMYT